MTMHLERGLTTTSTKKRNVKITKAQQADLERGWKERNVFLRSINLPKETFEQYTDWIYGRGKKVARQKSDRAASSTTNAKVGSGSENGTGNSKFQKDKTQPQENQVAPKSLGLWITGPCSSKPAPVYTGTEIVGIATMHKSNMTPIFNKEAAKDVASMRR